MEELIEKLNNNFTDEAYDEYYNEVELYLKELLQLLNMVENREIFDIYRYEYDLFLEKTDDEIKEEILKKIESIKSELSTIEKKEKFSDFPHYIFFKKGEKPIEAKSIEELTQNGINIDNGLVIEVYDTISEIIAVDLSNYFIYFRQFFNSMLEGKHLILKSKNNDNAPLNENTYSLDYERRVASFNAIIKEIIRNYGDNERGKIVADIFSNEYKTTDYDYVMMLHKYNQTGKVDINKILNYLILEDFDIEAIKKYLKHDFTEEDLKYYYNRIKKQYKSTIFKEMIDSLYGNPSKIYGIDISWDEYLKNLLGKDQKKDLIVLDILKKQSMIDFIDEGIKNYGISNQDEATNGSTDEIIKTTALFFRTVDTSGNLEKKFYDLLNGDKIIFYTPDQVKQIEKKYDVRLSGSCYNQKNGRIFVEYENTYNMFIVLVHEMMHYISHQNSEKANEQIEEFPSIYFEYQAEKFAERLGIKTNYSKTRISNSKSLYGTLKVLASINQNDFQDEQGNIDYNNLEKYLIEKNGSPDYIYDFIIDCYQILDEKKSSTCFSYVFSSALTQYCIKNNINPQEILDICIHLGDFSDAFELLSRLNISLDKQISENKGVIK